MEKIVLTLLADLPIDHPLRNRPLGELNAEYRWKHAPGAWRTVNVGAPKLVGHTYNELGNSWTDFDDWRVNNETR